jgi:hypothetical protein
MNATTEFSRNSHSVPSDSRTALPSTMTDVYGSTGPRSPTYSASMKPRPNLSVSSRIRSLSPAPSLRSSSNSFVWMSLPRYGKNLTVILTLPLPEGLCAPEVRLRGRAQRLLQVKLGRDGVLMCASVSTWLRVLRPSVSSVHIRMAARPLLGGPLGTPEEPCASEG